MRTIFTKIHLWISIPFGVIISVICLSGAALVFEKELLELTVPNRYFISEYGENKLSLEQLIPIVNAQLDSATVTSIQIPSDSKRNYIAGLSKGFRASAYVNPYSGKVVEITEFRSSFFGKVMQLHRWLLDGSRKLGKQVVGYSTLLFVLILITGMVTWWPKSKKHAVQRLKIQTRFGMKRFWMDMHTNMGFYLSVGLLVLSLTGLTYSFRWFNQGFYSVLGVKKEAQQRTPHGNQQQTQAKAEERGEKSPTEAAGNRGNAGGRNEKSSRGEEKRKSVDYAQWDIALVALMDSNPDFKTIILQNASATVTQCQLFGNARASDRYSFDGKTGEITNIKPYKEQPYASKVRGWVYTIHTGTWGGWFSKTITFLIAFIGGTLPLTGYYIFFVRRKKKLFRR